MFALCSFIVGDIFMIFTFVRFSNRCPSRYPTTAFFDYFVIWLHVKCVFLCSFSHLASHSISVYFDGVLRSSNIAFYRFYLVAFSCSASLFHSMRISFRWIPGFIRFVLKMLCHSDFYFLFVHSALLRCCMLLIESVFRCLCVCLVSLLFFFPLCLVYRIAHEKKNLPTLTLHINRKPFDRTFCSSYVLIFIIIVVLFPLSFSHIHSYPPARLLRSNFLRSVSSFLSFLRVAYIKFYTCCSLFFFFSRTNNKEKKRHNVHRYNNWL